VNEVREGNKETKERREEGRKEEEEEDRACRI